MRIVSWVSSFSSSAESNSSGELDMTGVGGFSGWQKMPRALETEAN